MIVFVSSSPIPVECQSHSKQCLRQVLWLSIKLNIFEHRCKSKLASIPASQIQLVINNQLSTMWQWQLTYLLNLWLLSMSISVSSGWLDPESVLLQVYNSVFTTTTTACQSIIHTLIHHYHQHGGNVLTSLKVLRPLTNISPTFIRIPQILTCHHAQAKNGIVMGFTLWISVLQSPVKVDSWYTNQYIIKQK